MVLTIVGIVFAMLLTGYHVTQLLLKWETDHALGIFLGLVVIVALIFG